MGKNISHFRIYVMFEKLKKRIKQDLNLELESFRRTRIGKHQKSAGSFVWVAIDIKTNCIYGSSEKASELVKRKEKLGIVKDFRIVKNQFEIS